MLSIEIDDTKKWECLGNRSLGNESWSDLMEFSFCQSTKARPVEKSTPPVASSYHSASLNSESRNSPEMLRCYPFVTKSSRVLMFHREAIQQNSS